MTAEIFSKCAELFEGGNVTEIMAECPGASAFAGGLVKVWPDLSVGIRACIKCDLEEAFDRDDRSRADGNDIGPLGQAVDRHSWALVRKQYKN